MSDPLLLMLAGGSVSVLAALLGPRRLARTLVYLCPISLPLATVSDLAIRAEHVLLPALALSLALAPAGVAAVRGAGRPHPVVRTVLRHPSFHLLLVFILLNVLATLAFAPRPAASATVVAWYTLSLLALVLVVASYAGRAAQLMTDLVRALTIAVFIGLGSRLLAQAGSTWGVVIDPVDGIRARGLALEPNLLAWEAATLCFLIATLRRPTTPWERAAVVAGVLLIPLTTTRAAGVGLLLGLLVYVVGRQSNRKRVVGMLVSGVGAVSVAAVLLPEALAPALVKAGQVLEFTRGTGGYRLNAMRVAAQDLSGTGWLSGLGTNSYGQRHFEPTLPGKEIPAYLPVLPLQIIYDAGVFALLALAGAAAFLVRDACNYARRSGYIVLFVVVASATTPFFFALAWILIALALLRSTEPDPDEQEVHVTVQHAPRGVRLARAAADG